MFTGIGFLIVSKVLQNDKFLFMLFCFIGALCKLSFKAIIGMVIKILENSTGDTGIGRTLYFREKASHTILSVFSYTRVFYSLRNV